MTSKNTDTSKAFTGISLGIMALIVLAVIAFGGYKFYALNERYIAKENELASTTTAYENKIKDLEQNLIVAGEENTKLSDRLGETSGKVAELEKVKKTNTKTITTLTKLTTYDPEILQKYSKVFFLNENYVPPKLAIIPKEFTYNQNINYEVHDQIFPFLQKMLEKATEEGVDLRVISAFRSFGTQEALKASYRVIYGAGTANQFSADQGYSEHQLGTTLDFTTIRTGASFSAFESSSAYAWLLENAHEYGFILSYPKGNAYYAYEPWHWRFVGEDLAEDLYEEGKKFYDLDQRELDKYLVKIFD